MSRKAKDQNQESKQLEPLKDALVNLHKDINDPASYKKWEDMEAKELLREINIPNLDLQAALENLQYWPEQIQKYFAKEVVESVRASADYSQKELEIIYDYFETALIRLPDCTEGQFPADQLESAMKAVSRQLQHYYGREDDDEEFPAWPKPR